MVEHRDTDDVAALAQALGDLDVFGRRRGVAAGVIVRDHNGRRVGSDGRPEHAPWVDDCAVEVAPRDDLRAQQSVARVDREHCELLARVAGHAGQIGGNVLRRAQHGRGCRGRAPCRQEGRLHARALCAERSRDQCRYARPDAARALARVGLRGLRGCLHGCLRSWGRGRGGCAAPAVGATRRRRRRRRRARRRRRGRRRRLRAGRGRRTSRRAGRGRRNR